jgi:CheY-like chemotaxis protein
MSSKRILICDDDVDVRLLVQVVLDRDYEFDEAADGIEALALARSQRPDLVVLDVMLPPGNGLDVLAEFLRDPLLRDVPKVVVTASPEQEEAAFAAGADRFFKKPFEPDELKSAVEELLGSR